MKKLVFIDESGNPGIKDEQGQFVIVGILIIREEDLNNISREFSRVKRAMHCADDFDFKFSKTKKKIIFDLFERLKDINFEVYAIVFEKKEFLNTSRTIYDTLLCELIKEMKVKDAEIIIDGKTSRSNRNKTAAFLRKSLAYNGNKVRYGNSKSYDGLQLADLVAGAIHRFYAGKKAGGEFMNSIKGKIRMLLKR